MFHATRPPNIVSGYILIVSPFPTGEKGCRARTRNYDEEQKQEQLTEARTQIGTQVLQDPELAKIVTAWCLLSPILKTAVLAILEVKAEDI